MQPNKAEIIARLDEIERLSSQILMPIESLKDAKHYLTEVIALMNKTAAEDITEITPLLLEKGEDAKNNGELTMRTNKMIKKITAMLSVINDEQKNNKAGNVVSVDANVHVSSNDPLENYIQQLPDEVLKIIVNLLSETDFNAALNFTAVSKKFYQIGGQLRIANFYRHMDKFLVLNLNPKNEKSVTKAEVLETLHALRVKLESGVDKELRDIMHRDHEKNLGKFLFRLIATILFLLVASLIVVSPFVKNFPSLNVDLMRVAAVVFSAVLVGIATALKTKTVFFDCNEANPIFSKVASARGKNTTEIYFNKMRDSLPQPLKPVVNSQQTAFFYQLKKKFLKPANEGTLAVTSKAPKRIVR